MAPVPAPPANARGVPRIAPVEELDAEALERGAA